MDRAHRVAGAGRGVSAVALTDSLVAVLQRWWPLLLVAGSLLVGLAVRLHHILAVDFPLNDGGLFYVMVRDIQHAGYALPAETSYNNAGIPFAYPPLSFYLAALLDDLTFLTLLDVFRFLPLTISVLTIGAFYLLARAMLPSRLMLAIAVPVFALLPRTYTWLIMGGGVARSLGFLFAILAILMAYRLYQTGERRYVVGAGVFAALTIVSHLETAWFVFFSIALLWLFHGLNRRAVLQSVGVVALTGALIAPWVLLVAAEHGLAPFFDSGETGGHSWEAWRVFLDWQFTEMPYFDWPAALALAGSVIAIARGWFFLPVWLVAVMLLDPRAGPTFVTPPLALLAGVGAGGLIQAAWRQQNPHAGDAERWRLLLDRRRDVRLYWPLAAAAVLLLYVGVLAVRGGFLEHPLLRGIDDEGQAGLAWVEANTPTEARFAVLTDITPAWIDPVSEWFPAIAERESVATPQGYEWFGKEGVDPRVAGSLALQACARRDAACLEEWREDNIAFTHVYIAAPCCRELARSLAESPQYELLVELEGASVYRRLP